MANITYQDKKAVVIGLGKTGLSCVRYLLQKGCDVLVMDSRESPVTLPSFQLEFPDVEVRLGDFDYGVISSRDILVLSPGVDPRHPSIRKAIESGMDVAGDIELFSRDVSTPVVAITGSNGKSTVTELVGLMADHAGLNVAIGGNLGDPALDLIKDDVELYVLELSSFQLETVSHLQATAAVVLNVSEDHMDRYNSMAEYTEAKARIYDNAKGKVVNLDDPAVTAMCISGDTKSFTVSTKPESNQYGLLSKHGKTYLSYGDKELISTDKLNIHGRHNYANALAAIALGEVAGLDMSSMLEALASFKGLAHRMEWVAEHENIQFINDSKATNVGATAAAVKSVDAKVVLIAGGIGKEQNFAPLREALDGQAKAVVLFGKDAKLIGNALSQVCEVRYVNDMQQAVQQAASIATHGDMVLLSPACASFDMYKGFEARGEDFCQCVENLLKEVV